MILEFRGISILQLLDDPFNWLSIFREELFRDKIQNPAAQKHIVSHYLDQLSSKVEQHESFIKDKEHKQYLRHGIVLIDKVYQCASCYRYEVLNRFMQEELA